jgi:hypothetical protein
MEQRAAGKCVRLARAPSDVIALRIMTLSLVFHVGSAPRHRTAMCQLLCDAGGGTTLRRKHNSDRPDVLPI